MDIYKNMKMQNYVQFISHTDKPSNKNMNQKYLGEKKPTPSQG